MVLDVREGLGRKELPYTHRQAWTAASKRWGIRKCHRESSRSPALKTQTGCAPALIGANEHVTPASTLYSNLRFEYAKLDIGRLSCDPTRATIYCYLHRACTIPNPRPRVTVSRSGQPPIPQPTQHVGIFEANDYLVTLRAYDDVTILGSSVLCGPV